MKEEKQKTEIQKKEKIIEPFLRNALIVLVVLLIAGILFLIWAASEPSPEAGASKFTALLLFGIFVLPTIAIFGIIFGIWYLIRETIKAKKLTEESEFRIRKSKIKRQLILYFFILFLSLSLIFITYLRVFIFPSNRS